MKKILILSLVLGVTTSCSSGEKKASVPAQQKKPPAFHEPWNTTFHLRETENGEILSIGAVYSDGSNVFVYDLAQGAVVVLDTTLTVTATVPLTSIGRNTYAGDDFIATDSTFIFLNAVDRRLEIFDRFSGKHLRKINLPASLMSGVKKRSHRILNRIFLDGKTVMIGNEHHLVAFDTKLGKRSATGTSVSAGENERVLLYKRDASIVMKDSLLKNRATGLSGPPPGTHFPVTGKRFFAQGTRLYAVEAGKDSVRIAEVK